MILIIGLCSIIFILLIVVFLLFIEISILKSKVITEHKGWIEEREQRNQAIRKSLEWEGRYRECISMTPNQSGFMDPRC